MTDAYVFNRESWLRVSAAVKLVEQTKFDSHVNRTPLVPIFSRHPLRMAITTEDISPDTYGTFKFTSGAKGSEVVTGDEYQGFYRGTSADDTVDLPSDTLCFAIWVPCDTLGETETGWELTPVQCVE